ncbi:undecaprenyl/decaprenyl-phosphate alpha-N-acetylglucosaminyl 1-phosphate transferase [bacterium]|jgi:UDP-GlcNAc:undecaprenyl-phosphate/decaprenyl-phosphate GlcNAc-1-phosphate transferase|nr:undecaprenyl/decaprenyl-phosphate alpha-N-acetylglucosaminyl 1-phosphate transferase [bacterium]
MLSLQLLFLILSSLIFVWLMYFAFLKFGLLDKPKKYGFSRAAVPYSFGSVLFILFACLVLFFNPISLKLIALLTSLLILVLTCFLDDFKDLNPYLRLAIQIVCAGIVVFSGIRVLEVSNPFGTEPIVLNSFSYILSIFWIVLLTNLINFLDGISGLSSGVSSIGFFTIFALGSMNAVHITDQSLLISLSLIAALVASLGFILEIPMSKPKVLLGDSGAMFFGFLLACLSMLNGGKLATLGLVLLVPIFDGLFVIFYRIIKSKSPVTKDSNHLHHKLLEIGFSRLQIVIFYIAITSIFGFLSIIAWNTQLKFVTFFLVVLMLSVFFRLTWKKHGLKRRDQI